MSPYLEMPARSLSEVRDELRERWERETNGEESWALYCRLIAVERELRNHDAT